MSELQVLRQGSSSMVSFRTRDYDGVFAANYTHVADMSPAAARKFATNVLQIADDAEAANRDADHIRRKELQAQIAKLQSELAGLQAKDRPQFDPRKVSPWQSGNIQGVIARDLGF